MEADPELVTDTPSGQRSDLKHSSSTHEPDVVYGIKAELNNAEVEPT
jgi:hypothetical protein